MKLLYSKLFSLLFFYELHFLLILEVSIRVEIQSITNEIQSMDLTESLHELWASEITSLNIHVLGGCMCLSIE